MISLCASAAAAYQRSHLIRFTAKTSIYMYETKPFRKRTGCWSLPGFIHVSKTSSHITMCPVMRVPPRRERERQERILSVCRPSAAGPPVTSWDWDRGSQMHWPERARKLCCQSLWNKQRLMYWMTVSQQTKTVFSLQWHWVELIVVYGFF